MKKIILLGIFLAATSVMADVTNTSSEQWTCYGIGIMNTGGPGGQIPMTVIGTGDSQINAMSNAQSRCFSQGLSMCRISDCFKK
jgi:hypothetical protein